MCGGLTGRRAVPGVISFSLQSRVCAIALDTAFTTHWQTMVRSSLPDKVCLWVGVGVQYIIYVCECVFVTLYTCYLGLHFILRSICL